ncbi:patatin-like phospholipase family protein [Fusobacterium perfoetens]|uniref:patatin-like phospholipase family protein n=1 Tax=Fusobacterium perfoetens TaxID=852 RepID=UPI000569E603|nr:patatin-like phospholipase family protein [Fusobacterium perfoetens]
MKKFLLIFLFIILSIFSFSQEEKYYGKINTKKDKINSIDNHIEMLEDYIKELEDLKTYVNKNKFDINKKNGSPKIALVLSGGGAKGAGHVGVLKVLEKYNVPIDMIIGTSAGSIVGAMYSIGYSPKEIEDFLLTQEFEKLFSNSPDRSLKNITQKINEIKGTLSVSIDNNNDIHFPLGVINGEHIYLNFKKTFERVEKINNFDEFPIKFRAVSTDINTGKAIALKEGDLAKAVLMSMAIPSIITPIKHQDSFFVDGGVANNFPVVEAMKAGADIIIAVDITADPKNITTSSNVVEVIDKISGYNSMKSTKIQKNYADILIVPNVKKFGTLDFENIAPIIKEGEIAAEHFSSNLKKLSNKEKFLAIKEKSSALKNFNSPINSINLIGNSTFTYKKAIDLKPQTDNYTIDDLNTWTNKIYALSYVDRIFYKVQNDNITFSLEESPLFKIYGNFLYVSNDYGMALNLNTDLPYSNSFGNNYYIKSEISSFPKLSIGNKNTFEIFDIDFSRNYSLSYQYSPVFLYGWNSGKLISKYTTKSLGFQYDISSSIFNNLLFGISSGWKYSKNYFTSGLPYDLEDKDIENYIWGSSYIIYDNLDSISFPTKGSFSYLAGFVNRGISNSGFDFHGYKFNVFKTFPINKKLSFGAFASGGQLFNDDFNYRYEGLFKIGGTKKFSLNYKEFDFYGIPYYGLVTDKLISGGISLQYNVGPNVYIIGRYNTITFNSDSNNFFYQKDSEFASNFYNGYGIGLGWDTLLGPLEFSLTNDSINNGILFNIYFGYTF